MGWNWDAPDRLPGLGKLDGRGGLDGLGRLDVLHGLDVSDVRRVLTVLGGVGRLA